VPEIVPLDELLITEAQVQPNDIDDLAVGQSADVNLTGFKQRDTSLLVGKVVGPGVDIGDSAFGGAADMVHDRSDNVRPDPEIVVHAGNDGAP
jgi:hypothetical protein